ncbi:hypothetical protein CMI37_37790 [Candidatus Pacearchaeota archaeon]|nr:hypothetical protein [Candidatus Pacearchaeota archaeon]
MAQLVLPGNPLLVDGRKKEVDPSRLDIPFTTRGKTNPKKEFRLALRAKTATDAVGDIYPDCDIYGLTKGQFDLRFLLAAVLKQTGPADLTISTWTCSAADVEDIASWGPKGMITSCRWVMDYSFQRREPKEAQAIRKAFGTDSIRITKTHAKFYLITNPAWNIAVRTSANLNMNPRTEDFNIVEDQRVVEFLSVFVDSIFKAQRSSDIDKSPYEQVKQWERL